MHHTLFACSLASSRGQYWCSLCLLCVVLEHGDPRCSRGASGLVRSGLENLARDSYWEGTCRAHLGLLSLRRGQSPGAGLCSMGRVRALLESPSHGSSGPGRTGEAEEAGAHRPASGLGELGRRQARLSRETARPGVVQMCDWLCWAAGLWMYPHFADSKTMAPQGTRIHKIRDQCKDVCNKDYVTRRLLTQLMGPARWCWSVIPLTVPFSLPLLSTPPCSPDSVLEPNCGPTLPGLCTFRVLPPTAPGPGSEGPALPLGLALPPSASLSPRELSLEAPCPQVGVPTMSQALS